MEYLNGIEDKWSVDKWRECIDRYIEIDKKDVLNDTNC